MEFNGEPKKYSRREIFTAPFDHFKDSEVNNTDTAVEYTGEALSVAAMMYLAYRGSQDQLVTYEVKSESRMKDLPEFSEIQEFFSKMSSVFQPLHSHVSSLNNVWTDAYEETVCVPVTKISVDSDGDSTTETTIECHDEWDEPLALRLLGVDHYKLSEWQGSLWRINNQKEINKKEMAESFDLSHNGASLFYSEKAVDSGNQFLMAGLFYGILGGMFCTYEEALHHLTDDGFGQALIDDNKHIKRRTFMKLGAAAFLSFQMRGLQRAFVSENKDLLSEIKENTNKVLANLDVDSDTSFKRVMGLDIKSMRNSLVDIRNKSRAVLTEYSGFLDSGWYRVRPAFEQVNSEVLKSIDTFDKVFSYDEQTGNYHIPEAINTLNRNLYGTREINRYAGSKSTQVNTRHLTDALLMALGLGAIAAIGEKAVFPLTDKILETRS